MSNLKDAAKDMLSRIYLDRMMSLAKGQLDSPKPQAIIMHAFELLQVENVTRVLQAAYDEGRNAGIHDAVMPIIREADARTKPSPAKKVLEALCKEVRALKAS